MMAQHGGLPYDAEVGYLESTGTQFINSGLYASPSMRVVVKINYTAVNTNGAIFRSGTNFWYGVYVNNNLDFAYTFKDSSGNFITTSRHVQVNTDYVIDFDGPSRALKINSINIQILGTPATLTSNIEMPILSRVTGGGSFSPSCSAKLYYCKIYVGGTMERDLIPVRVGTVGYMYDRVSGQLFGNVGTGDFVLGPDVQ